MSKDSDKKRVVFIFIALGFIPLLVSGYFLENTFFMFLLGTLFFSLFCPICEALRNYIEKFFECKIIGLQEKIERTNLKRSIIQKKIQNNIQNDIITDSHAIGFELPTNEEN